MDQTTMTWTPSQVDELEPPAEALPPEDHIELAADNAMREVNYETKLLFNKYFGPDHPWRRFPFSAMP